MSAASIDAMTEPHDQEPTMQEPTLQDPYADAQDPRHDLDPAAEYERASLAAEHTPPFVLATTDLRLAKVDGTVVTVYDEDTTALAQDLLDGVAAPVASDMTLEQVRAKYERFE